MGKYELEDNYLKIRTKVLVSIVIAISFTLGIYSIYIIEYNKYNYGQSNKLRVETSIINNKITHEYLNNREFKKIESKYNFAVINLEGQVIYSRIDSINKKINLTTEIGYDNNFNRNNEGNIRYSVPLVNNNRQEAIIVMDLPKSILIDNNYIFKILIVVLFMLSLFIISFIIYKFINKDIILPINQMHRSAKRILHGDYEEKIYYDYDGEVGSFCHDFEEMRDELRNSRKKEEKLKKREKELLACISHDLKTPLSSIFGYIEGIRDGIVKDREGIKRYSNIVLRKARDLSKLIDDILEQSKAEINEMSIVTKEIYSDVFFNNIIEDLKLDVSSKKRNLIVDSKIPKTLIDIDVGRMKQVIYNVIGNAIKYSKENGVIEFKISEDIDKLLIEIRDNGIGINEIDIPFIFDKFYRSEKHRNMNIPGSGLGLSISKYIVESHGGSIKCKSKLGEGTSIIFSIPKV